MAKRKQAAISVITAISIVGVAAGVMALIIALAITNGFRNTLQKSLLSATAHINVMEKQPGNGIANWRELVEKLRRLPHVQAAAPSLYGQVFLSGPRQSEGAVLKGVEVEAALQTSELLHRLKEGKAEDLKGGRRFPGIILGARLAEHTGLLYNSIAGVISPQGELTPYGMRPVRHDLRVVGIFETGFYDLDRYWAYTSLEAMQRILSVEDVINSVELKLDDPFQAPGVAAAAQKVIGDKLVALTWMEQNRNILNALRMDRVVTVIVIGLIELVAALNILITLIMMVMEKYRDIAILLSMGARREQIRRIFIYEGVLIGTVGTFVGLIGGYTLAYLADHYRWIRLDEQVYSFSFVPFEPRWIDGLWVAAVAILISYLATLYPARNATKIGPAEALRYE